MMNATILAGRTYLPGDPPPEGYLAWHEWAEAQYKSGLRQEQCGRCGLWKFPQELSPNMDRHTLQSKKGPVVLAQRVCCNCHGAKCHD